MRIALSVASPLGCILSLQQMRDRELVIACLIAHVGEGRGTARRLR